MFKKISIFFKSHILTIILVISMTLFMFTVMYDETHVGGHSTFIDETYTVNTSSITDNLVDKKNENIKLSTNEIKSNDEVKTSNEVSTVVHNNNEDVNTDLINSVVEEVKEVEQVVSNNKKTFSSDINPHSVSGLSVEQMNQMLVGTGLESNGQAFYDMEHTYNVNALFAMGVAMHESANGYKLANTYNYFGFRGKNGWMSFESPYSCIQYFGKLIHNNYSGRNTINAIQSKYCPDGSAWASRVKAHINQLIKKI